MVSNVEDWKLPLPCKTGFYSLFEKLPYPALDSTDIPRGGSLYLCGCGSSMHNKRLNFPIQKNQYLHVTLLEVLGARGVINIKVQTP
jgi:hypothetical protein